MRIRRSIPSPYSPSSCSSSSSSSSTHSTISTHSLSSSSNSTSSSSPTRRCEGLDLLIKAVYHVAGSTVGVPYIQRRVIRRRKRAVRFSCYVIDWAKEERENDEEVEEGEVFDCSLEEQKKKQRSSQNSVLESWKPKNRRRRRSSQV